MGKRSSVYVKLAMALPWLLLLGNCIKDRDFGTPERACTDDLLPNATYSEVKALFAGTTVQILEDLVIEGYVVSSDRAGNFFSTLHFQDSATNATEGFQIDIDLRDSHLFYGVGQKVFIKLNGLYLGRSGGVFKLGGVFPSFGNLSVGRLPAAVLSRHLFVSCGVPVVPQPREVTMDALQDAMVNTLVQFKNVELSEDEVGIPFAVLREETKRTLMDCNDNTLTLLNSGFADFQAEPLPEGNGSITGVLVKENNNFELIIRELVDMDFSGERCAELIDEFTSDSFFISELADPDNSTGARFVELFNAGSEALSLKGWTLRRYTNANTEVSSSIDLTGFTVAPNSTLVISPNAAEFELVYGFPPDMGVSTNSPADSNGDDNLELVDPFNTVIDLFGVIGEDGSGTNHEFEDGRAVRKPDIIKGNPVYTFGEWEVYNDTGGAGTINQPQNSPEDFSPGERDF